MRSPLADSRKRPTLDSMPRAFISFILMLLSLSTAASAGDVVRTTHFTIEAEGPLSGLATKLGNTADTVYRTVAAQLGTLDVEAPLIHVHILSGGRDFSKALKDAPIADWAAGVAFPRQGKILLRIDSKTQFTHNDVFKHEVSHIVLARAVKHAHLPHWFIEGVAVHQAGERLRERWSKASTATLTDSLMPLSHYDATFPRDGTRADLAYAESTAFVGYLLKRYGWRGIRTVVHRVRAGETFHDAFNAIYGATVVQVEAHWRTALEGDASWIRIFGDTTVLWSAATVLFVFAWWVTRRKTRARLAALGRQEEDDEFA